MESIFENPENVINECAHREFVQHFRALIKRGNADRLIESTALVNVPVLFTGLLNKYVSHKITREDFAEYLMITSELLHIASNAIKHKTGEIPLTTLQMVREVIGG